MYNYIYIYNNIYINVFIINNIKKEKEFIDKY
jgi:hypothetical protein